LQYAIIAIIKAFAEETLSLMESFIIDVNNLKKVIENG
jgi:hypothetical protein